MRLSTHVIPGTRVNLTPGGNFNETRPDWSPVTDPNHPNYNRIAYVSNRAAGSNSDGNNEIYTSQIVFTNGVPSLTGRVQVTNTTTISGIIIENQFPRWAPDGNYIAYSSNMCDGTDYDVHRIKYNTTTGTWGNRSNLTNMRFSQDDEFVAWDPQLAHGAGETPDNTYRFAFMSRPEDISSARKVTLMEQRGGGIPTFTLPPWTNSITGAQRYPDW